MTGLDKLARAKRQLLGVFDEVSNYLANLKELGSIWFRWNG